MHEHRLRLEFGSGGHGCVAALVVPWTHVLADVTSKDMVAHSITELVCDLTAFFYRQVRNAAARIQFSRSRERLGGAGINTARATSAAIRGAQVGRDLQRGKNHA